MSDGALTLWRPTGKDEYDLVYETGMISFPSRLPQQPIFYPVLNRKYAIQIAREWNSTQGLSGYVGVVLVFEVERPYVDKFDKHVVGEFMHTELWVPALELEEFNRHIVGPIRISDVYYGDKYEGQPINGDLDG